MKGGWVETGIEFSNQALDMPPQRLLKSSDKLHKIPMGEFLDNLTGGEKIRSYKVMSIERSRLWSNHYGEAIYNPVIVKPDRTGKFKYSLGDGRHRTQSLYNAGASHIWVYILEQSERYPKYTLDPDNSVLPKVSGNGRHKCNKCERMAILYWDEDENDIYYRCKCGKKEYRKRW